MTSGGGLDPGTWGISTGRVGSFYACVQGAAASCERASCVVGKMFLELRRQAETKDTVIHLEGGQSQGTGEAL